MDAAKLPAVQWTKVETTAIEMDGDHALVATIWPTKPFNVVAGPAVHGGVFWAIDERKNDKTQRLVSALASTMLTARVVVEQQLQLIYAGLIEHGRAKPRKMT